MTMIADPGPTLVSTTNTQELADLSAAVLGLCLDAGDLAPARSMEESRADHDVDLWRKLGVEMGLACIGLPEPVGGLGGLADIVTVAAALGTSLAPVPFWSSTVLAGQILAGINPLPEQLLRDVAGGAVVAAVIADADGQWDAERVAVQAHEAMSSGSTSNAGLTGVAHFVAGAVSAQHLVVAARGPDGVDLYLVEHPAPSVDVRPAQSLDLSRPLATVELRGASATPLTGGGSGGAAVQRGVDVALVALAAEQAAGAQRVLDMTVNYAKLRRQFSRPIGGFQVVKHRLVDLLARVEFAHSAVDRAVETAGDAHALSEAAAVAAAWCADAYRDVCADAIQLHGGIGFTWEHDAHLFFRRAHADAVLLGGATFHRERIAALLSW